MNVMGRLWESPGYLKFGQPIMLCTTQRKQKKHKLIYFTMMRDRRWMAEWKLFVHWGWVTLGDLSRVECVTHNEVLANRIMGLHRQRLILRGSRDHLSSNPKKPSLLCCCTTLFDGKKHDHALVVSHPHGQPKKITVGKWRRDVDKEDVFYEEYHAATCPGSSGAPVLHLYPDSQDLSLVLNEPGQDFVHCGNNERSSIFTEEVNYAYGNCWVPDCRL